MRDLSTVRDGWEAVEALETQLLQEMTLEEGLAAQVALQIEFEPQLQETDALFRPDREAALVNLQRRLFQFADWYRLHGS